MQLPGLGLVTPLLRCVLKSPRLRHTGLARSPVSRGDASGRPSSCPKPVTGHTAPHGARPVCPAALLAPCIHTHLAPFGVWGAEGREAVVCLPSKPHR